MIFFKSNEVVNQNPYQKSNDLIYQSIGQYPKLEAFFEDGRIELDNNRIENVIRPMPIRKKLSVFLDCTKQHKKKL